MLYHLCDMIKGRKVQAEGFHSQRSEQRAKRGGHCVDNICPKSAFFFFYSTSKRAPRARIRNKSILYTIQHILFCLGSTEDFLGKPGDLYS